MQNPYATPESPIIASVVEDEGAVKLASRWKRLGAALLDVLFSSVVIWPIVLFVFKINFLEVKSLTVEHQIMLNGMGIAIYFALNGYLLYKNGQTLGKYLVGIKIVDMHTNKMPFFRLVFTRIVPMWVLAYIPVVGGVLNLINILFIFRSDRRCIHDLIAGTQVVRA